MVTQPLGHFHSPVSTDSLVRMPDRDGLDLMATNPSFVDMVMGMVMGMEQNKDMDMEQNMEPSLGQLANHFLGMFPNQTRPAAGKRPKNRERGQEENNRKGGNPLWEHFEKGPRKKDVDKNSSSNVRRAICKYCKEDIYGQLLSMGNHLLNRCSGTESMGDFRQEIRKLVVEKQTRRNRKVINKSQKKSYRTPKVDHRNARVSRIMNRIKEMEQRLISKSNLSRLKSEEDNKVESEKASSLKSEEDSRLEGKEEENLVEQRLVELEKKMAELHQKNLVLEERIATADAKDKLLQEEVDTLEFDDLLDFAL